MVEIPKLSSTYPCCYCQIWGSRDKRSEVKKPCSEPCWDTRNSISARKRDHLVCPRKLTGEHKKSSIKAPAYDIHLNRNSRVIVEILDWTWLIKMRGCNKSINSWKSGEVTLNPKNQRLLIPLHTIKMFLAKRVNSRNDRLR